MDVGDWLRNLGLGQYEDVFRDNGVDGAVLPKLTVDDLKEMGVAGVGHRRKIIAAIEELNASSAVTTQTVKPLSTTSPASVPRPIDAAERRQLTVMFCDLVGSTALSARLDPEDLRGIIGAYQRSCTALIERNGGFVAKYMGDAVLAYFGYPRAHEHDAERAVQAGLDACRGSAEAKDRRRALPCRSASASPPGSSWSAISSARARRGSRRLSARRRTWRRVCRGSPSRAWLSSPRARESCSAIYSNWRNSGAKDLKGISGPVQAWAALCASSVASRFEALHTTGLTALVGREEEFELLLRRWSRAKAGQGQVVLLSGEAGIGKSRLTAALMERLAGEPYTRLRYFCSPQHTDSALYPIIGQMERAAGLAHDDTPQPKLDKLDKVFAQAATSPEDAALLAEMLSLPNDGRYPTLDLAPQQRRERTLVALASQLEALTRASPALMILEDAHWVDPTSLEAFGRTVDRIRTLPVLLIVTFRPEFTAPWLGQSHVTSLTLNRLGEREAAAIIARLVGNKELPADVLAEIVERTDGIPLFVEEMTKAVLEAESEGEARRTAAAVPSPAAGGSREPARFADGAARPTRKGQGGGADRVGDRAGVFLCLACRGGA